MLYYVILFYSLIYEFNLRKFILSTYNKDIWGFGHNIHCLKFSVVQEKYFVEYIIKLHVSNFNSDRAYIVFYMLLKLETASVDWFTETNLIWRQVMMSYNFMLNYTRKLRYVFRSFFASLQVHFNWYHIHLCP